MNRRPGQHRARIPGVRRFPDHARRSLPVVGVGAAPEYGEHSESGHVLSPYDEEVRVSLLIQAPGLASANRVPNQEVDRRNDPAAGALDRCRRALDDVLDGR